MHPVRCATAATVFVADACRLKALMTAPESSPTETSVPSPAASPAPAPSSAAPTPPKAAPETPVESAAAVVDAAPSAFALLGLAPEIVSTLTALGYEEPTPIQKAAIPPLLAGRDVLGQAATGTGKTAAFALPLLQRVTEFTPEANRPLALVLVPTRELAMQVAEAIHKYGKERRLSVLPIFGGQSYTQQFRGLDRGVSVVVATPGRARDHLDRGSMKLDNVRCVVLDEADEMLDMGFADDLDALLAGLPKDHQTALFSATLPPRVLAIAEGRMRDPLRIEIARERTAPGETPRVKQTAYLVSRAYKPAALGRVLDLETPSSAIVFCRTRVEVDELTEAMNARGYRAESLHGGFQQDQRDRVMGRFRSGKIDLLVATDVAARGLDIDHVSHVVNYDVPSEPETYVHRIGRTGRAGREGTAITLVEPRENRLLRNIEFATRQRIALETIPTVADLRRRRLELTRAALREAVLAGDLQAYRGVVDELASEFDVLDLAAAAVKMAHLAGRDEEAAAVDEQDIPAPRPPRTGPPPGNQGRGPYREQNRFNQGPPQGGPNFEDRRGPGGYGNQGGYGERRGPGGFNRDERGPEFQRPDAPGGFPRPEGRPEGRPERPNRPEGHGAFGRPFNPADSGEFVTDVPAAGPGPGPREGGFDPGERRGPPRGKRFEGPPGSRLDAVKVFIGAGRMAMLRPGDLVGAITNETGLGAEVIGSIQIADRFSLVEVRAEHADQIIQALRATKLRGLKVPVRRDRES